ILERSPDATRQLASRARRRIQGSPPTADVDPVRQRGVVEAFLRAAQHGDFDALVRLLDPDVVFQPDAAAQRMGALREMRGATELAGALSGGGAGGAKAARLAIVDGLAGFVWAPGGRIRGVAQFRLRGDVIVAIDATGDEDRIAELDIVTLDA